MSPVPYVVCILLACFRANAQGPACSALELTVETVSRGAATTQWRVLLRIRSERALRLGVPPEKFSWRIEERTRGAWSEVLTGGVGPGKASSGAKSKLDDTASLLRTNERLLIGDFDVRRDLSQTDLTPQSVHRITFAQDVYFQPPRGGEAIWCTLTAKPQVFRSRSRK